MFKLHGIYAPIATPFAGGKIAYDRLEKNLLRQYGEPIYLVMVLPKKVKPKKSLQRR